MGADKPRRADGPWQLFDNTKAQRVATARRQFFEDGKRPSGLVSEAVIQSWMRCYREHPDAGRQVHFGPVSSSRLHLTQSRCEGLVRVLQHQLPAMERAVAGVGARVLLTDADGVMLYVTRTLDPHRDERVGMNFAEAVLGTTAPGIVIATGKPCTVIGAEHYFDDLSSLRCTASPIRDTNGQLMGVLNFLVEGGRFGFDAGSMVKMYSCIVENAWMQSESNDHLILGFQLDPTLLHSPLEGLAAISSDGMVSWLNEAGNRLVGPPAVDGPLSVEDVFGCDLTALLGHCRSTSPSRVHLANGLSVWLRASLQAPDGLKHCTSIGALTQLPALPEPTFGESVPVTPVSDAQPDAETRVQLQPGSTLREHDRRIIEQTLMAHDGNVSRAARQLGVSRGTLYRRMREMGRSKGSGDANESEAGTR